jgi:hypothetical protein
MEEGDGADGVWGNVRNLLNNSFYFETLSRDYRWWIQFRCINQDNPLTVLVCDAEIDRITAAARQLIVEVVRIQRLRDERQRQRRRQRAAEANEERGESEREGDSN